MNWDAISNAVNAEKIRQRAALGKGKGWNLFNPLVDTEYSIRLIPQHPVKNPNGIVRSVNHDLHESMLDVKDEYGKILKTCVCLESLNQYCPWCEFIDLVETNKATFDDDFLSEVSKITPREFYGANIVLRQDGRIYYWSFSSAVYSSKKNVGLVQLQKDCPNFDDPVTGRDIKYTKLTNGHILKLDLYQSILDKKYIEDQYNLKNVGKKKILKPDQMKLMLMQVPAFAEVYEV